MTLTGCNFVIWGSSGHAKVLRDMIEGAGGKVVVFFDNDKTAISVVTGAEVHLGMNAFHAWLENRSHKELFGAVAIGGSRGSDRHLIAQDMRTAGILMPALVHTSAVISSSVKLGRGTQVLAGSVIAADAVIGDDCILNHQVNVDHECVLEAGVHLAPSATLCGCIHIGKNTMVGAGAVILPSLTVGKNCIVGAGAIVTKSVPDNTVVCGNPARPRPRRKV
jgi:sugar O-acyltransferase (sialic acid O-acetyltransferase NeuD family)